MSESKTIMVGKRPLDELIRPCMRAPYAAGSPIVTNETLEAVRDVFIHVAQLTSVAAIDEVQRNLRPSPANELRVIGMELADAITVLVEPTQDGIFLRIDYERSQKLDNSDLLRAKLEEIYFLQDFIMSSFKCKESTQNLSHWELNVLTSIVWRLTIVVREMFVLMAKNNYAAFSTVE